jgi:hypothetical protein
VGEDKEEMMRL